MKPKLYFADEHDIDLSLIDSDALFILEKLHQAGFIAYLVGGSVRDLLLKKHPKDFDISTSARPEEIKSIFQRRCILIGRRFRLAHIRFGHKIIEVSTFRSGENITGDLIVHDNEWGTPEEDVLRRDFTINGLFYDSANQTVIDYVGGWEDIQQHTLRVIGEPEIRFKQDPVRMLRLVKFEARFGFNIEANTEKAIYLFKQEIVKSSQARVLEEIFRMLESGSASPFFQLLGKYGFFEILFSKLMKILHTKHGKRIFHYLSCADKIHLHKRKQLLDRSLLTSCFIFPILEYEIDKVFLKKNHVPHLGDIILMASKLIKEFLVHDFPHFPRRISSSMISILVGQYRLTPIGKRHYREKLYRHKDFNFALKFLKIRALVDEKWVDVYSNIREQSLQHIQHGPKKHHHPPPKRDLQLTSNPSQENLNDVPV
ncbi:MAG: polynucleotide adenylyltransferase PcnB [Parachlamydiaceae bacterium]|nr:polynucleotide adenylyltransferase PcnB [Parachlamydiaceae bacterium]